MPAAFSIRDRLPATVRRRGRPLAARLRGLRRGTWPYPVFYFRARRRPEPRTFTEKLRHKMLHDRDPILRVFADKVAARSYVENVVGGEYLPAVFAAADDVDAIDWGNLPREYVCKASHASGGTIIVWDRADPASVLPRRPTERFARHVVRPEAADPETVKAISRSWLRHSYGNDPGFKKEWAYRRLPRRVLVEELLLDEDGEIPRDVKFLVINGTCQLIQIDVARFDDHQRMIFRPDMTPLDVAFEYPRPETPPPGPKNLDEMIELAERLARGRDLLRVDLYDLGGRIVVGELTNYPEGGVGRFDPPSFDLELGALWELSAPSATRGWRARRARAPSDVSTDEAGA